MKKSHLLAVIGSAAIIVGCASEPDEYDVDGYEPLTDPAILHCIDQDGEIERASEGTLRVTYCKLSDEDRVEIKAYYQKHLEEQQAQ